MAENLDLAKLDKRTIERLLRNGTLDEKTYEKFLKTLPDRAEDATSVETTMVDDEGDDDDLDDDEA